MLLESLYKHQFNQDQYEKDENEHRKASVFSQAKNLDNILKFEFDFETNMDLDAEYADYHLTTI